VLARFAVGTAFIGVLFLACAEAVWPYDIVSERVSATQNDTRATSIALGESGEPRIALMTSGSLRYAWLEASSWHMETVDDSIGEAGECSLAIDSVGRPHVVYVDRSLDDFKYAYKDATGWHVETVADGFADVDSYISLAIDGADQLHVAYSPRHSRVGYAFFDGSAWQTEVLYATDYVYGVAIALGPSGYAHIVMCVKKNGDPGPDGVRYAYQDITGWTQEDVAMTADVFAWLCSIDVDGAGRPHITYYQQDTGDEEQRGLRYALREGTSWSIEWLAQGDDRGVHSSIRLNSLGHPRVAWFDERLEEGNLYLTYSDGAVWHTDAADLGSWCGRYASLALDMDEDPLISYSGGGYTKLAYVDKRAPSPDPTTWAEVPVMSDQVSVSMAATAASDPSGVEYYFDETTGHSGGNDSGWQTETSCVDAGLDDSIEYCYRVRARDSLGYETDWSTEECVTVVDTTPPIWPDPWDSGPYESSGGEISMTINAATDPNGVEYHFEETTGNAGGDDSGWQDGLTYTDSGLEERTQYCYQVKARDKSSNGNETAWSSNVCKTTTEWSAPTPDPMTFATYPEALGERSIRMVATTASDTSVPIEYYFTETSGNPRGTWSVWQESTELVDWGLQPNTTYCYNVRARDAAPNQNETAASATLCARTNHLPVPTGAPAIDWKGFSHGEGPEYPSPWSELKDVAVDPSGNIYAVGELGWDDGLEDWNGVAVVTKYAPDGTQLWHDLYELPDIYCHPRAACTDTAGNLYIVGAWAPPGGAAWPGWFLTKMSADGRDVSTYSSDSSWCVLYSVDVDAEGYAYVCGNFWIDGWFTGKFDFESGSYVWTRGYAANPDTNNLEDRVEGVLGADGYYVAKNYTANENDGTLMVRHRLSDGIIDKNVACDLAAGTEELVTALAADAYGQIVGTAWAPGSNSGQIVKFGPELNLEWNMTVTTDAMPYLSLRSVTTGPDWRIYAVGREGNREPLWQNDEDSHAFVFCTTGDGTYLWDHTYDAGGPSEKEWGVADGVGCAPDGTQTYVGATLSYSETGWARSLSILAYGDDPVEVEDDPTAASFRVVAETGEVRADGTIYAAGIGMGAADVAEWICISEPVEPGDVLEHDPERPGCYRLSSGPASSLIAGVVSTKPGAVLGEGSIEGASALLALTGIVPVKVMDEGGPIQTGDLLVSSSTPGHAMRWPGEDGCLCTLVGKALEPMTGESGVILVLLTAH